MSTAHPGSLLLCCVCLLAVCCPARPAGNRAIDKALGGLANPCEYVRLQAVDALGASVDDRARAGLVDALRDPSVAVRARAAHLLGQYAQWMVTSAALTTPEALEDEMAEEMAHVLTATGTPALPPYAAVAAEAHRGLRHALEARKLAARVNPSVAPALIAALGDADSGVRRAAAGTLGALGDQRAMQPLIDAFQDPDAGVQAAASHALVAFGTPAINLLALALEQASPEARAWAVVTLGRIGAVDAVRILRPMLQDPDPQVRAWTARVLGDHPAPDVLSILVIALQDREAIVRAAAAQALGRYRLPEAVEAIEPLITATRDYNPYVGQTAQVALTRLRGMEY